MDEKTYNEFLLKEYQCYIETLKKEGFIALFTKAYHSKNQDEAENWWNQFNKWTLIDKIQFFIDDEKLNPLFKGYCIGYGMACGDCY